MLNLLTFLTFDEFLFAIVLAFFTTWIIKNTIKLFKLLKDNSKQFNYRAKDIGSILNRCYALFPKDILKFRGQIFKRGMKVRVVTLQNKIFEGEFIGSNSKNMVCILTKKHIIAHEIANIMAIKTVEKAN